MVSMADISDTFVICKSFRVKFILFNIHILKFKSHPNGFYFDIFRYNFLGSDRLVLVAHAVGRKFCLDVCKKDLFY